MKRRVSIAFLAAALLGAFACTQEKKNTDRHEADEMFRRICKLTEEYTCKLEAAPDSADWAALCTEFEEKLDKISFSYPPDTDLLLTEGQNDTIHFLMQEYVKTRGERIDGIMHPEPEIDSLSDTADALQQEAAELANDGQ